MNLKHLETFLQLSETLNYTKVSQKLYISQTAVTKQIQNLEKELGVELFERSKRQVCLTPAGKIYVEEAKQILENVENSIKHLEAYQRGERGILRIGFLKEFDLDILIPLVKRFHEKNPYIEMDFGGYPSRQLIEKVKNGELDIIICAESKETENFVKWKFQEYPLVGIVNRKDQLAQNDTLHPEELKNLIYDFRDGFEERKNMDMEGALLKVACNLGQAIAHDFVVDQNMRRYVKTLPLVPYQPKSIFIMYHPQKFNRQIFRFMESCIKDEKLPE